MTFTPRNRAWLGIAAPFIVALLLRLVMLWVWHGEVVYDGGAYVESGKRIADGYGFTTPEGFPNGFRSPGLPFLLGFVYSVFGYNLLISGAVLLLLEYLTVPMIAVVVRQVKDSAAGNRAAWIWGLQPFSAAYALSHHSDSIGALFLLLIFYLYIRSEQSALKYLLIGTLAGMLAMFRPVLQVLPLLLVIERIRFAVPAFSPRKKILLSCAMIVVGYALVAFPWMARNHHHFGKYAICYQTGTNFYIGWHQGANGGYSYTPADEQGMPPFSQPILRESILMKRGMGFLFNNPVGALKLTVKKVSHAFVPYTRSWEYFNPRLLENGKWPAANIPFWLFATLTLYSVLLTGMGWYVWKSQPLPSPLGWVIDATIYFCFISMFVFFADPRFRLPVDISFAILIAVHGFSFRNVKAGYWRTMVSWGGVALTILTALFYFGRWFMS